MKKALHEREGESFYPPKTFWKNAESEYAPIFF